MTLAPARDQITLHYILRERLVYALHDGKGDRGYLDRSTSLDEVLNNSVGSARGRWVPATKKRRTYHARSTDPNLDRIGENGSPELARAPEPRVPRA